MNGEELLKKDVLTKEEFEFLANELAKHKEISIEEAYNQLNIMRNMKHGIHTLSNGAIVESQNDVKLKFEDEDIVMQSDIPKMRK